MADDEQAWLAAVRASVDHRWCGHEVVVVTCHSDRSAVRTRRRLQGILGERARLLTVVEQGRPGNLIGTLMAWRAACEQATAQGWDLDGPWRAGELTAVLVHNAGLGLRASPLTHAEDNERGALLLPGRLAAQPARLLEAVLAQCSPLARSQRPGQLDVLWSSQLFVPQVAPERVPRVNAPLVKLVTAITTETAAADLRDVGIFALVGDKVQDFAAQGTLDGAEQVSAFAAGRRLATDLGSFRIRHDLLDILTAAYVDAPVFGPRDVDPHLTGPILALRNGRPGGVHADEVRRVIDAVAEPIVAACILGEHIPWWRLRRPAELRRAALDLLPSNPDGATLRTLLGIEYPVSRSWLGGVWVEGPEITWQQMREGLVVGAVHLRDAIVQDSALWAGRASVHSAVVCHSTGALAARDSLVMACGVDGLRAHGGMAWRVGELPSSEVGLAPTFAGLCAVDRPRLIDGRAVLHGFLEEDGKAAQDKEQPGVGLSWTDLRALPTWVGPELEESVWSAAEADEATPWLVRDLPEQALQMLQDRLPSHSDLHRWASLAAEGSWRLALHRGSRPHVAVDGPLIPGRRWNDGEARYALHLDLETWQRWQHAPQRMAEALVRCWSEYFAAPHPLGRRAWAQARTGEWRQGGIEVDLAVKQAIRRATEHGDARALLDGLDRWDPLADADRTSQGAWFEALDGLQASPRDIRTAAQLRGWLRWRLDHVGDDIGAITEAMQVVEGDLVEEAGFLWTHPWLVGERWVPRWSLRPSRPPDQEVDVAGLCRIVGETGARVIGIAGPAASGKSRLVRELRGHLKRAGNRVQTVAGDELTWRGPGFRYLQQEDERTTRLFGPGIYDDRSICAAIDEFDGDRVIVDGVFLGLDPDVRQRLDLLVVVIVNDDVRLGAKFARDAVGGHRRIDVVTDFACKIQHESRDGVQHVIPHAQLIWDRGTSELWRSA